MREQAPGAPLPEAPQSDELRHSLGEGFEVVERKTGPRLAWNADKTVVSVNTTFFPSVDAARTAALRQAATQLGMVQALREDAATLIQLTKEHPKAAEPVLRWQGLARLRENKQKVLRELPIAPQQQTFAQEFSWALDMSVLTGKLPAELSPDVRAAIAKIPAPQGKSLVEYIASGRYLQYDGGNFTEHIQPLLDELSAADTQTGRSAPFEYRPSQRKDIAEEAEEKEALKESQITVRVEPFYGGYYREQVCRYDPNQKKIVNDLGMQMRWHPGDPPEDEAVWKTKRMYRGTLKKNGDTIVKLPYHALPLVNTLQPAGQLTFMRDEYGTIVVAPKSGAPQPTQAEFSFEFVLHEQESNALTDVPVSSERTPAGGNLDAEMQQFLDSLASQPGMSDVQKARDIVRFLHKKLRYPNDEAEVSQIDGLYLNSGYDLWITIAKTGVAHCYWANILRDEMCKRLGIASRIPMGPYVGNKDPRFAFAIVEAPGVDKHAWGEVWDPVLQRWTHKGMDATPPKKQETEKEEPQEPSEPLEGDFGGTMEFQPELTEEEVEQRYEELSAASLSLPEEAAPNEPTMQDQIANQFEEEKGVSLQKWRNFETWVQEVNNTVVPAESSIRGKQSTLYQEWRDLFDLLYKKREVPVEAYKGPVRQSEGEFLEDPVTAYIDVRARDEDPLGYHRRFVKQKEQIDVTEVDDDFILDTSGSMAGVPEEELQKMVLSSSYNMMKLNERLQHSQVKSQMRTPLRVRSAQFAFGSEAKELTHVAEPMSEKVLLKLQEGLRARGGGSEGLVKALQKYKNALDAKTLADVKKGTRMKMLTIVSDGGVMFRSECAAIIAGLREQGIIVQGIGFGSAAQDIRVVCHDPNDPEAAIVINDVRQAALTRQKVLMKHLSKL